MILLLNSSWLRYIGWARCALAAVALALSFADPIERATLFRTLIAVFFIYTALVAWRMRALSGMPGLLALVADTAFFLVLASLGSERLLWIASLFFLYLLTEALIFYTPVELVAIVGVCAIFCGLLPFESARALLPTVLVAGTLACGFAVTQQRAEANARRHGGDGSSRRRKR